MSQIVMSHPPEQTHIDTVGTYVKILLALLVATAVTTAVSRVDLGDRCDHRGLPRRSRSVQHRGRAWDRVCEDAPRGAILHAPPPQYEANQVGGVGRPAVAGDSAAAHPDGFR